MRSRVFIAAVAALAFGGVAAASPVTGLWQAPVAHAQIQVYDCGTAVCGKVVDSDNLRANPHLTDVHNIDPMLKGRPVRGLVMMQDFQGGPAEWKDGKLYNPDDGHTYHGSITLVDHDTLKLSGCVFGPFCRTQTWTRLR